MNVLFVHQNFPGQFKFLAPALAQVKGLNVAALTMNKFMGAPNITSYAHYPAVGSSPNIHPWVGDFETKVIRAESAFKKALQMKGDGYYPDLIIAHHGWGESMFLKDVWPRAKLGLYCEFFYHTKGADIGFDPEFPSVDFGDICKLRLKNVNNLLHLEIADAGISPTYWQASVFPETFRSKITVVHDGVDTDKILPNNAARLTLALPSGKTLDLKKGDEIITFVNRNMEPYRGYHIFMRSLPGILKKNPNVKVIIVGGDDVSYGSRSSCGGKWRDIFFNEVKGLISAADLSRIYFLGKVPYEYFIPLLQVSSVHVYLTYPFVLSWSLIEAMSAGCAIVASDTAPVREAIKNEDTGLLVDFFDVSELTEKVSFLLRNHQVANTLRLNAREFAVNNYDLKKICLPKQVDWVKDLVSY